MEIHKVMSSEKLQHALVSRILGSCGALLVLLVLKEVTSVQSQLSVEFYDGVCPNLTNIMREAMNQALDNDPVNVAALLRLWAHDAFVNGVDGSVLLHSVPGQPQAEKDAPINLSLFGFDAIDNAKFLVEQQCPGVVSCADILTLAAQLSIEMTGGPIYNSLLGRRDSTRSLSSEATAEIPTPHMTMDELVNNFAAKNLTKQDLVVLQGAHTIGFAHCKSFSYRMYGFSSTAQVDPSMDPSFASGLTEVCSQNPDPGIVESLDNTTTLVFDEQYYVNLRLKRGLLQSDQILADNSETAELVDTFASDVTTFYEQFVEAMLKFGSWNVLTGNAGEIRSVCTSTQKQFLSR